MEMIVDAFGPKCLVIISIHIKESHEIRIPPSSAIQSSCKSVLFASRFIHTTLTANSVTTVAGMALSNILISVYNARIFIDTCFSAILITLLLYQNITVFSSIS